MHVNVTRQKWTRTTRENQTKEFTDNATEAENQISKMSKKKKPKKKKDTFNVQGNDFFFLSLKHYLLSIKKILLENTWKRSQHYNLVP